MQKNQVQQQVMSPFETLGERFVALEQKLAALEDENRELQEKVKASIEKQMQSNHEAAEDTPSSVTNGLSAMNNGTNETPRARVLINRVDPKTKERRDYPEHEKLSIEAHKDFAFTLRKVIDPDGDHSEIDIHDLGLWALLKSLLGYYPYHSFRKDPVTIQSPFAPFIFNWERLEEIANDTVSEQSEQEVRADLLLLLNTIKSGSGDIRLDRFLKNRPEKKDHNLADVVTYETLWTMFPPGTLVYGKPFQRQDQLFIVKSTQTWPEEHDWSMWCWIYDWNGKDFRRMSVRLDIEKFEGHKPIRSLPFYPFKCHENHETIRQILKLRGENFRMFCTAKRGERMWNYEGEAILGRKGFSGMNGDADLSPFDSVSRLRIDRHRLERIHLQLSHPKMENAFRSTKVDSLVMVDFESYFQYGPAKANVGSIVVDEADDQCGCHDCMSNEKLKKIYRVSFDDATGTKEWDDEQYMLCPPRVLGYILRDKTWAQLQVDFLQNFKQDEDANAWSYGLQLAGEKGGEKTKQLLMGLVKGHGETEAPDEPEDMRIDDIVAGKGKGLVMLLYGPPGVGKTSTAETVANAAGKPLFSVSAADVGTEAKLVESNLARIFDLATTWRAILLIDEADVFLESRQKGAGSSTEKNALVSVFLRVLEYYKGILILTTNQIAHFDIAVQSRIHIAIRYEKLKADQTMAIFDQFLTQLERKGRVKDKGRIYEWLRDPHEGAAHKKEFDGRQIRNIMTCSWALALAEKKSQLELNHVKKILFYTQDFKDDYKLKYDMYINSQHGMLGE